MGYGHIISEIITYLGFVFSSSALRNAKSIIIFSLIDSCIFFFAIDVQYGDLSVQGSFVIVCFGLGRIFISSISFPLLSTMTLQEILQ